MSHTGKVFGGCTANLPANDFILGQWERQTESQEEGIFSEVHLPDLKVITWEEGIQRVSPNLCIEMELFCFQNSVEKSGHVECHESCDGKEDDTQRSGKEAQRSVQVQNKT